MNVEKKKTILIVDDEVIIAMNEKMLLEKYGYDVILSSSGEDAIRTFEDDDGIDLILMDIDLGKGINGPEAAVLILKIRDIPIVFLSSHTEPEIVEKTEKITSYGYVVKNSGITVLDASIKMAFKLFDAYKKNVESEFSLSRAEKVAGVGNWKYFLEKGEMVISKGVCIIYGIEREVLSLDEVLANTLPGYREKIEIGMDNLVKKGIPFNQEFKVLRSLDGKVIDIQSIAIHDKKNGIIFGIIQDITERKRMEEKLIISNEMFQKVLDTIPQFICWKDRDSRFLGCNKNYAEMIGFSDSKSIVGKTDWDLPWKKEETEHFLRYDRKIMETDTAKYNIIESAFDAKGKEKWLCTSKVPLHDTGGNVNGILVAFEDITERQKSEETLKNNERLFQMVMDNIPVSIAFIKKEDMTYRFVNQKFADRFNLKSNQLIGKKVKDILGDTAYNEILPMIRFTGSGKNVEYENKLMIKGTPHWFKFNYRPEINGAGELESVIVSAFDISDRKIIEESLLQKNALFEALFNSTIDGILVVDNNGKKIYQNHRVAELWKIPDHVANDPDDDQQVRHVMLKTKNPEQFSEQIYYLYSHPYETSRDDVELTDGTILDRYSAPVLGKDGVNYGRIWLFHDITERKKAEEEIKGLLTEKDLILKEVHHRINNNMNIIYSILNLQAESLKDEAAIAALKDAGNRVQSMMILYQKLFLSEDFKNINIASYLHSLISEIVKNFQDSSNVKVIEKIDSFVIDTKKMQFLGIIINELITNIMKYAFKGKGNGLITVTSYLKEKKFFISLEDDGVGMPELINFENSSGFGLMLVGMLTRQLEGNIRIERGNGTKIILEFGV
jgi:PAS domain S-box-containing protein